MVAEKCYKHPFKKGMTKVEILSTKHKAKVCAQIRSSRGECQFNVLLVVKLRFAMSSSDIIESH